MTNKDKAEATKNKNEEINVICASKKEVVDIVRDLQKIVKELKKQKSSTALVTEYENAIAVLTNRVKLTSGNFDAVISDLRERIEIEMGSKHPDTKKIQYCLDVIERLEKACV